MKETVAVYDKSKSIMDYKFPKQVGLTMRTIESIGHRCKLITNNQQVKFEDFYTPENVYVYDLDSFDIPVDFLKTDYIQKNYIINILLMDGLKKSLMSKNSLL